MSLDERSPPAGRWVRRGCAAWYRALLLAYPRAFRLEHGDEAAEVFGEACQDGWRTDGARALLRRLLRSLVDVPRGALAEHRAVSRTDPPLRREAIAVFAAAGGDFRQAVRSFRKRPLVSATIVATLALGIGANTAMFSVVDATLLRPLPYVHPDRVVYLQIQAAGSDRPRDPTIQQLQDWIPDLHGFERIEARAWESVLLAGDGPATRVRVLDATPGYLDAMGSRPILGRWLRADDGATGATPVVVLSETLWKIRYAGSRDIVGRPIGIDGVEHLVVGVVPNLASDVPGLRFRLYQPLPTSGPAAGSVSLRAVAWLKRGVSIEAARAEFQAVVAAHSPGTGLAGDVVTPRNLFRHVPELRDPQLALMGAVFLLLLIAGVNVANLQLAAGQARRGELAVRRALGASRWRVARLLLVESVLLALAGCGLGLLVAQSSVLLFTALDPGVQLQTQLETIRLDGMVLGYAIGIALVTGVAFGVLPALRGSATPPQAALRDTDQRTMSRLRHLPGVFVAAQVALSIVLLVSAGLVVRTFVQMRYAETGFDGDQVLTVRIALPKAHYPTTARQDAFFDTLLGRAAHLPGVTGATIGYGATPPTDFVAVGDLQIEGRDRQPLEYSVPLSFVRPEYFDVMGIPILAGTGLREPDMRPAGPEAAVPTVVSRSFARRFWPDGQPIGVTFAIVGSRRVQRYRIVGVAGDIGRAVLAPACTDCDWQLYAPLLTSRQYTDVLLRVADGAPLPAGSLRRLVTEIDPQVPADDSLQSAAASLYEYIRGERFRAAVFGAFAALALVLVGVGLFAVISHSVSRRTREMGIRLALGAQRGQVRRLVMREGLGPTVAGLGIGLAASLALTRTLRSFLFGVSPTDPATLAAISVLLLAVAGGALLAPALRATRVDPVQALRSE